MNVVKAIPCGPSNEHNRVVSHSPSLHIPSEFLRGSDPTVSSFYSHFLLVLGVVGGHRDSLWGTIRAAIPSGFRARIFRVAGCHCFGQGGARTHVLQSARARVPVLTGAEGT